MLGSQHFGGKGGNRDYVDYPLLKDAWNARGGLGPGDRPLNLAMFKNVSWESSRQAASNGRPYLATDDPRLKAHQKLNMEVYHCPSDTGLIQNTGALAESWSSKLNHAQIRPQISFFDIMGNSYTTNGPNKLASKTGGYPYYSFGAINRRYSSINNPANSVLYREGNSFDVEFFNSIEPDLKSASQGLKIDGWHGGEMEFTAAFADGHANTITQLVTTDVFGQSPDGMELNRDTSKLEKRGARPIQVQMPYNLDYGDILGCAPTVLRGNGWQLDYWPAPMTVWIADPSEMNP